MNANIKPLAPQALWEMLGRQKRHQHYLAIFRVPFFNHFYQSTQQSSISTSRRLFHTEVGCKNVSKMVTFFRLLVCVRSNILVHFCNLNPTVCSKHYTWVIKLFFAPVCKLCTRALNFINWRSNKFSHKNCLGNIWDGIIGNFKKFIQFTLDYDTVHIISADQEQMMEWECQLMQVYMSW